MQYFGWQDGVPDDFSRKIDEARKAEKWKKAKRGAELDAYIAEVCATLDPALAKKFDEFIRKRLNKSLDRDDNDWVTWEDLVKLSASQGKEFTNVEELSKHLASTCGSGHSFHEPHGGPLMGMVKERIYSRCYNFLDTVICLDAATGKDLWRKSFPGAFNMWDIEIGASGTPAVWNGKVYANGSAGMYCLDIKDGNLVWQASIKSGPILQGGRLSHSSPLVAFGAVYAFVPQLTAFDAATGRQLWVCEQLRANRCTSASAWSKNGRNFVVSHHGCVDAATGKLVWGGGVWDCYGTPLILSNDTMLISNSYETILFKLTPQKCELIWKAGNKGDPRGSNPVVCGDYVYMAGACYSPAPVRCFDLKTGAVKWETSKPGGCQCSSAIASDDKIFINVEKEGHEKGNIVMLRATPEKYEELGRIKEFTAACSSPAMAGGKLYVRMFDHVACYDLEAK
jgi:outer membrane protein assembly factor BamB